jgi:PAS domain S-box-containing protein
MTPARILIVEDERITAEHLHDILSDLGYTVTAAVASGAAAIHEAERTQPDLILMDIHLEGDIDGVEAARTIRDRLRIPAVYLTAHADQETLRRAREAEPLGYVVKPFQETELQASIEMALYKARADREAEAREQRLAAMFRAMGEGLVAIDQTGAVTLLNPAAEGWTGWRQQDATGRRFEEVFRIIQASTRTPVDNPLRRASLDGVIAELESGILLISREGPEHRIAGTAAPIRDHNGKPAGAVLVFGSPKGETAPASGPGDKPAPAGLPAAGMQVVFESRAMQQIMDFTRRVAASEASTILLEGESGTGKDVLAKFLHYGSRRAAEPFVAINCAAIPETLLESELFGYEKGAFTDARSLKKGTLELANGGTVFLDEIGEMPPLLQVKLLRVLEEQNFRRLGGTKSIQLDLRVIAATNRSLAEAVRDGSFRVDLYYRLNVIQIAVPPLRDRRDDILPLAHHFVHLHNQRFRRDIKGLSPEAERLLVAHEWPGNVRELRNTIERAMLLEDGSWLQPSSLALPGGTPLTASPEPAGGSALDGLSLDEAERMLLVRALKKSGGNQTHAARMLSISRDALRYKMKKFNLGPAGTSAG